MIRGASLTAVILVPDIALAHGGLPGGGGFYSGVVHPFLALEQTLALLALGLLLGQQPGRFSRSPLAGLAVGLGLGLATGTEVMPTGFGSSATLGFALIFAGLLALALPVGPWGLIVTGGLAGWVVGLDTDMPIELTDAMIDSLSPYAGVFTGVFLIVLNAAALAHAAQRPPWSYGVRVAGSWMAAIALMVLALGFRSAVRL